MPERRPSRLPTVVFGLLLALCVVMALAFVMEEVPFEDVESASGGVERVYSGHGVEHSRFPSMSHGGSGAERHTPILWLAWGFAMLQVGLIVACFAIGITRVDRVRAPLVGCALVLGFLLTMMVVSYRGYMVEPAPSLVGWFPGPTAWYLYAYWPAQFLLVGVYVVMFDRAILTPADLATFREILAKHRPHKDRT